MFDDLIDFSSLRLESKLFSMLLCNNLLITLSFLYSITFWQYNYLKNFLNNLIINLSNVQNTAKETVGQHVDRQHQE